MKSFRKLLLAAISATFLVQVVTSQSTENTTAIPSISDNATVSSRGETTSSAVTDDTNSTQSNVSDVSTPQTASSIGVAFNSTENDSTNTPMKTTEKGENDTSTQSPVTTTLTPESSTSPSSSSSSSSSSFSSSSITSTDVTETSSSSSGSSLQTSTSINTPASSSSASVTSSTGQSTSSGSAPVTSSTGQSTSSGSAPVTSSTGQPTSSGSAPVTSSTGQPTSSGSSSTVGFSETPPGEASEGNLKDGVLDPIYIVVILFIIVVVALFILAIFCARRKRRRTITHRHTGIYRMSDFRRMSEDQCQFNMDGKEDTEAAPCSNGTFNPDTDNTQGECTNDKQDSDADNTQGKQDDQQDKTGGQDGQDFFSLQERDHGNFLGPENHAPPSECGPIHGGMDLPPKRTTMRQTSFGQDDDEARKLWTASRAGDGVGFSFGQHYDQAACAGRPNSFGDQKPADGMQQFSNQAFNVDPANAELSEDDYSFPSSRPAFPNGQDGKSTDDFPAPPASLSSPGASNE